MSVSISHCKHWRWHFEYWAARAVFTLFGALSIDAASALGAVLFRAVGPRLHAHEIAGRNLRKIFPHKSDAEIAAIQHGIWDNLGRTFGELPHLAAIGAPRSGRVEVIGGQYLEAARDGGRAVLFLSAHFGNWEIVPGTARQRFDVISHSFFRAPNNPLMVDLLSRLRRISGGELLAKGRHGARRSVTLLKEGKHLALLADQKMNDGIEVPFMGQPAMTAPALATLALKFDLPVIPIRCKRLDGAHFQVITEQPLPAPRSGNREQDIATLMERVNETIGCWVEQDPEQWFWIHRRWKE